MKFTDLETIANIIRNDADYHYSNLGQIEIPITLNPSSMFELQKDCDKITAYQFKTDLIKGNNSNVLSNSINSLSFGRTKVSFKITVNY